MDYNKFINDLNYEVWNNNKNLIVTISKHNNDDCISISRDGILDLVLRIEPIWETYKKTNNFDICVKAVQEIINESEFPDTQNAPADLGDYEEAKHCLVAILITTDGPKSDWANLMINKFIGDDVFAVPIVLVNEHGGFPVDEKLLSEWKIPDEQLWQDVVSNLKEKYPAEIWEFDDYATMKGNKSEAGGHPGKVITCGNYFFGNSVLLYPDLMEQMTNECDDDFFVLFTSPAEVVIYPQYAKELAVEDAKWFDECASDEVYDATQGSLFVYKNGNLEKITIN